MNIEISYLFYGRANLKYIEKYKNIVFIQEYAFAFISSLDNIIFSEKIASILEGVFQSCSCLKILTFLGNNLEMIYNNAFSG